MEIRNIIRYGNIVGGPDTIYEIRSDCSPDLVTTFGTPALRRLSFMFSFYFDCCSRGRRGRSRRTRAHTPAPFAAAVAAGWIKCVYNNAKRRRRVGRTQSGRRGGRRPCDSDLLRCVLTRGSPRPTPPGETTTPVWYSGADRIVYSRAANARASTGWWRTRDGEETDRSEADPTPQKRDPRARWKLYKNAINIWKYVRVTESFYMRINTSPR